MDRLPANVRRYRAAIFDMDGVVTQTATVHARAWKETFDAFLAARARASGEPFAPFDAEADYLAHVDGLPRQDGVRSFLATRGIELPEGEADDPPERETVHGLGSRKDALVQEILERDGVDVFPDWLARVRAWRADGLRTAVVSSSRNCQRVIAAAGVEDLLDTRVDGETARELGLRGKPAPDLFLVAAERLGVPPEQSVVFEDAVSGVEAGAAAPFGLVVGVARHGDHEGLSAHGADVTVTRLTELG